jgi:hypothetical protein
MTNDNQTLAENLAQLPAEANRRGEEAEHRLGATLRRHNESVLTRLTNPQEHRVVREHLAAELAQGFEYRRAALSLAMESRLQSIREACNHVLMTGKTQLRQERIDYFGQVYRQLETQLQELADAYIADADTRFARVEKIASEHLRERERARQKKSALDFLDTLDQLMDEFRGIIGETIRSPGSQPPPIGD